jgi:subtilisin family serine protease
VGIATVIAAGNDGRLNAISEPACISSAVSVSATDDSDEIPSFSNAAAFLSLWAPGLAIRAPLSGSVGFIEASGTSMAAPHVAGAWAMLRQADPSASVDEILTILQNTGLPIPGENGLDDDGDGLIDFDGGASANGGVAIAEPDPGCTTAWSRSETPATPRCGIGFELALLMPPLLWRFARRRGPGRF